MLKNRKIIKKLIKIILLNFLLNNYLIILINGEINQQQQQHHHQQQILQGQKIDENCETLPTEIHLIKEEYDELGRLQRTCNGEVMVNKCEGLCSSQVQPSVITPTGFLKECYCCRETYLRERIITLTHCYDPDGVRLTTNDIGTLDIKLKEPAECRCYKCGDFSR